MPNSKHFKCASVGGTFNSFHKGHKEYLDIAFSVARFVVIHIVSDEMAKRKKNYSVKPLEDRLKTILAYLKEKHWQNNSSICAVHSGADLEKNILCQNFDVAIVEPAYFSMFISLNKKRRESGKEKICIIYKPRTVDLKGNDISSTMIESEKLILKATKL